MKLAVTGHRPDKLFPRDRGFVNPYAEENNKLLIKFAVHCLADYRKHAAELGFNCDSLEIITGMALGWDQAIAQACVSLGIPFIAACPCKKQETKWFHSSQVVYNYLLTEAKQVVYVHNGSFNDSCMQKRNIWMVDHSDGHLLALWDGTSGGTGNCIKYAVTQSTQITNGYNSFLKYRMRMLGK